MRRTLRGIMSAPTAPATASPRSRPPPAKRSLSEDTPLGAALTHSPTLGCNQPPALLTTFQRLGVSMGSPALQPETKRLRVSRGNSPIDVELPQHLAYSPATPSRTASPSIDEHGLSDAAAAQHRSSPTDNERLSPVSQLLLCSRPGLLQRHLAVIHPHGGVEVDGGAPGSGPGCSSAHATTEAHDQLHGWLPARGGQSTFLGAGPRRTTSSLWVRWPPTDPHEST